MNDKILVLDFDGVICNSLDECMFSAYNAYLSINNRPNKINNLNEINKLTKEEFYRLRPFIKSGEEFILSFFIINKGIKINNHLEFNKICIENKDKLTKYKDALYKERDLLLKENNSLWLNLNPLFEISKFIKQEITHNNIFILTTKRAEYVSKILQHNNINFPKKNIISSKPEDKIKNIKTLLNKKNVKPSHFYFIEDQIEFLLEAKNLGVNVCLVDWGYINGDQKQRAKENKIPLINTEEFGSIIKKI